MSNAEPMGNQRRANAYGVRSLLSLTPRQRRRYVHKDRHLKQDQDGGYFGKGRPTPRQRKPSRD